METRTDIHRVSQIKPEEYTLVLCYALATVEDGWPVPPMSMNCEVEHRTYGDDGKPVNGKHGENGHCCVIGLREVARVKFASHGGPGTCTVCGTHHVYGDVWRHEPTGEHIFVGHICANKYGLIADRRDFEREHGKHKARSVREHHRGLMRERREGFLAAEPGLAEALETDHHIVQDINDKLSSRGELSDAQVELVFKIAKEEKEREARRREIENEVNVPAPIVDGRQTVRGKVVSVKTYEGAYGPQKKMTVKVHTSDGTWLAWGTCPNALLEQVGVSKELRGATVEFDAKLKPGREAHFALISRPTKARIVEANQEAA